MSRDLSSLLFLLPLLLCACEPPKMPPITPGDVFSVEDGGGGFRIARVTAFDSAVIHLRLSDGSVRRDPIAKDTSLITGGAPVRQLHVDRDLFLAWKPVALAKSHVDSLDIEELRRWERSGKQVVGGE